MLWNGGPFDGFHGVLPQVARARVSVGWEGIGWLGTGRLILWNRPRCISVGLPATKTGDKNWPQTNDNRDSLNKDDAKIR
jgi:hypothetical protein